MLVPTVHNEANKGDIANVVIMPGDPLRAKYIADNYLTDVVCYNKIRGMLGFTGKYRGIEISVQGSGMGVPSMGIYSKELFEGYNVDTIIRVGSIGSLMENLKLGEIVVADKVESDSNYAKLNNFNDSLEATPILINELKGVAQKEKTNLNIGKVFTSDVFYSSNEDICKYANRNIIGVEMETLALYTNAKVANKNALAIFTISNNIITGEEMPSKFRETSFDSMIKLALELALKCNK